MGVEENEDKAAFDSFLEQAESVIKERRADGELEDRDDDSENDVPESEEDISSEGESSEKPAVDEEEERSEDAPGDDGEEPKKDESGEGSPVDDSLVERAVRVGMSLKDAMSVPVESLRNIVARMEQAGDKSSDKDESEDEGDGLLSKLPNLDPEVYDKEIIDTVDVLKDIIKNQDEKIKAMVGRGGQSEDIDQSKAEAYEFIGFMDAQVAALGESYSDVFGKGSYRNLQEKERNARCVIATNMDAITSEKSMLGEAVPTREKLFEMALNRAFGEKVKSVKAAAVKSKAAERQHKVVTPPRDSTGKFTSSNSMSEDQCYDEAVKVAESFYK